MTAAHAVYSPSSAYRWFACPGSIGLIASLPAAPAVSVYASEGSAAHALAAECLNHNEDAVDYLGDKFIADGVEFVVDESMVEGVQVYLDYVRSKILDGYVIHVEVKLDLGHLWPGQFGTGDAVLHNQAKGDLIVADLKFGRGVVVDVENNPQLLSYASGALQRYRDWSDAPVARYDIRSMSIAVIQPRAGGEQVRVMNVPLDRLRSFEDEFRAAALRASAPDAALVPGSWCQFCAAAGICPALKDKAYAIARAEFGSPPRPTELTLDELGNVLDAASMIEDWIEAVKREALRRALAGELPAGWKVVRKNTHRKWLDEAKAAAVLRTVYEVDEDRVYTRKIVSPAQAEKLLSKADRDGLASLIRRPPGDPTLAPEYDKREPLKVDVDVEFGRKPLREALHNSVESTSNEGA
jgi:Protein of unknown function (DUF2800)